MKRTTFTIRLYLVSTLWLLTMLTVIVALIGPLRGVYVAVELDVAVRTALTMALAMTLATAVAAVALRRFPLHRLSDETSRADVGRSVDAAAA